MNNEKGIDFLDRIREILIQNTENIAVAGLFGSREEDLDILLVMKDADWQIFAMLCRQLQDTLPNTLFFPTFRVQEFLEMPSEGSNAVHLLAYSSLAVFLAVERPFTSYCIARELIPFVGDVHDLGLSLDKRPVPDLNFYDDLLFQTGQIFLLGKMAREVKLREVRKKLLYVIKFSMLEAFHRPDDEIDFHNLIETLFRLSTIPNPLLALGTQIFERVRSWKDPNDSEIESCFSAVVAFLRDVRQCCC